MSSAVRQGYALRGPEQGLRRAGPVTLLTLLAAASLTGCVPAAGAVPATAPDPAASASEGGAPTSIPSGVDFSSTCSGPETATENGWLKSVEVVTQADQLVIAYTLATPVAGDMELTFSAASGADVADDDTDRGFTVTVGVEDGFPVRAAVQTPSGTTEAENAADVVHVVANTAHIGMPAGILDPLGASWHWSASAVSGNAHAACPVAPEGAVRPEVVTVP